MTGSCPSFLFLLRSFQTNLRHGGSFLFSVGFWCCFVGETDVAVKNAAYRPHFRVPAAFHMKADITSSTKTCQSATFRLVALSRTVTSFLSVSIWPRSFQDWHIAIDLHRFGASLVCNQQQPTSEMQCWHVVQSIFQLQLQLRPFPQEHVPSPLTTLVPFFQFFFRSSSSCSLCLRSNSLGS